MTSGVESSLVLRSPTILDRKHYGGIGATMCRVLRVEGTRLYVAELDALDGTPVLDIKPVMVEFLPGREVKQPAWSHELMREYWLRKE